MAVRKIWVDTNIIIRFITSDHPEMTKESADLMKKAENGDVILKVAAMVVAECCWVLNSNHYGFAKKEIGEVLAAFLTAKGIEAEEELVVLKALEHFSVQNVDFIDAYLAEHVKASNPDYIVTFNATDFDKLNVLHNRPSEIRI